MFSYLRESVSVNANAPSPRITPDPVAQTDFSLGSMCVSDCWKQLAQMAGCDDTEPSFPSVTVPEDATMTVNLQHLLDDEKCDDAIRERRWLDGGHCPHCDAAQVSKGRETTEPARQTSRCGVCLRDVDELTGTVLAGHHQPLQVWVLCLGGLKIEVQHPHITCWERVSTWKLVTNS